MFIYKITNKINKKSYIGQTIRPVNERWNEHKSRFNKKDTKLARAIRKYGLENFEFSTIYEANTIEELNKIEKKYIENLDTVNNGYNIKEGGWNCNLTDEIKNKISKANKGKKNPKVSESNRKRIGEKRNNKNYFGNKNSNKSILCIENQTTYRSITQASKELNISTRSIHDNLKGRYDKVKGFSFKYI